VPFDAAQFEATTADRAATNRVSVLDDKGMEEGSGVWNRTAGRRFVVHYPSNQESANEPHGGAA